MSGSGWFDQLDIKRPTEKLYVGSHGLLAVVLHVADDHGNFDSSLNWLAGKQNPNSSSHVIIDNKTGRLAQMASIHDRTWANGLKWPKLTPGIPWSPAANRPIIGAKRALMWKRIVKGMDPNKVTVSIERSGDPDDAWTPQALAKLIAFLRYIARETGIVYVHGDTLIGHRDIDPLGKGFCPGPLYDFPRIASLANGQTSKLSDPDAGVYVVSRGPARVRSAANTSSTVLRTASIGEMLQVADVDPKGELLNLYGVKSSAWAELAAGGYVWVPLLRRVT